MSTVTDKERLEFLLNSLEYDGYGYWLPDWCVRVGEAPPTIEEFVTFLDEKINHASKAHP